MSSKEEYEMFRRWEKDRQDFECPGANKNPEDLKQRMHVLYKLQVAGGIRTCEDGGVVDGD